MSFYFDPRFYSLGLSINVATLAAYIFYRSKGTGSYDDSDDFAARVLMGHVENGRRSIIRWKKEIEGIGLIKSTKKSNKHGATVYEVCAKKLAELTAPKCDNESQTHAHTCDNVSQGGVTNSHTYMGQIVTQKEALKESIKEEETRARAQAAEPTPPQVRKGHKGSKGQKHPPATQEEIAELMSLLHRVPGLCRDNHHEPEEVTMREGVATHGVDGMKRLIKAMRHDRLMQSNPQKKTLRFLLRKPEKSLAALEAFEADEAVRRRHEDEKRARDERDALEAEQNRAEAEATRKRLWEELQQREAAGTW